MKTLLVLAPHPELAEAVQSGIDAEHYRIIHRATLEEAEPLLVHGMADACIVDVELTNVQSAWMLEKLRSRAPKSPMIVYTAARQWEWEEEAYLRGATHVLSKPVRPRTLNLLLSRLWQSDSAAQALQVVPASAPNVPAIHQAARVPDTSFFLAPGPAQALSLLRDFSNILTHSLNAEAMLTQFLHMLRDTLSVNRAAIFLRAPSSPERDRGSGRRLRASASVGLSSGLLEHFELTLDSGIGAHLDRFGRILRRGSEDARNPDAQKEFELLGVQVAVPILDRESVIGAALFDARITGEPLSNPELELIFRLLEPLGLAIRNIWLHAQVASNQEMLAGILRELSSACIVVNRDLAVLHANKMARRSFSRPERHGEDLEFSDLPHVLGSKVYQVLKTGSAVSSFKYEPENSPGTVYNINIVPFQRTEGGLPGAALLMADDLSQTRQLQRLELEAASLRLVKNMADRLTHEIGNAMVPLSTHQQLLADKWKDPEFRASLDVAMADGVKRVTRLINQMRFLARDALISPNAFPLAPLIEEAFQEARKYQPVKSAQLKYDSGSTPVVLTGDRAALKHALAEVMLNALQANPADPKIGVKLQPDPGMNGGGGLQIEVQDNGTGFTTETAEKAPAPFFTTRNVGLGLGLTVSRKIIETHHGRLEILPPSIGGSGIVRISLPLNAEE
jgi:signal transduction histidine kinase/DNA-binding NarL/FixJ family response regulator